MADKVHNKTQSIVDDIKSGLHGIHGAGEALRGGAMEALDSVFHKKEGEARDREIYERGVAEMRGTEDRFEARQYQPHEAHHVGAGHGLGHSHHDNTSHGQGSHFANAHARDVTSARQHEDTTIGSAETDDMGAAKAAWQEKH